MVERAMKRGFFPESGGGRVGRAERTLLAKAVQTVISDVME